MVTYTEVVRLLDEYMRAIEENRRRRTTRYSYLARYTVQFGLPSTTVADRIAQVRDLGKDVVMLERFYLLKTDYKLLLQLWQQAQPVARSLQWATRDFYRYLEDRLKRARLNWKDMRLLYVLHHRLPVDVWLEPRRMVILGGEDLSGVVIE